MSNNVLACELFGVIFISVIGTLLHFTYGWSNEFKPLALISAVNESTWEHLKIAFWPALIYSIFEYEHVSNSTNNFLVAKAACLLVIPLSIIIMFYTYTKILGHNLLFIDISIFILSIVLGQIVNYKLLTMTELPFVFTVLAVFIIALLIVQFSLFTFFPPRLFLFRDPVYGDYGIYTTKNHKK